MKFIIAVDCEGVACSVGSPGASLNESRNLPFAQLQATREADAAARGLFEVGAEQVIIWDNHNGSLNLDYDRLDERCDIALGVGFPHRFPGLDDSFTGVLFIGYHAMDNVSDAVMCHSFSSTTYQYMKMNGHEIGEMGIDGAVAGAMGVPVLFVASDDKAVTEAQSLFPGISTVITKEAYAWNAAISKHPNRVIDEIYHGVQQAVIQSNQCIPFRISTPINYEIRYKRIENAQNASQGYKSGNRLDPYTVQWQLERLSDYF